MSVSTSRKGFAMQISRRGFLLISASTLITLPVLASAAVIGPNTIYTGR